MKSLLFFLTIICKNYLHIFEIWIKVPNSKKKITIGFIRWWRYIIVPVVLIVTLIMIQEWTFSTVKILILLLLIGIVYLLWKHRRLKFDSKNLYRKRGKEETNVPLANIVSIKKSKTKINSERFWILIYLDEQKMKKKLRFNSSFNK